MVAYDEPCVVPIKRTLQKIDYQNQAYKELEVRPQRDYHHILSCRVLPPRFCVFKFSLYQLRTLPCFYLKCP